MNNRNLAYDRSIDYAAWRPALIAFYRADCWFMSAECLERGDNLSAQDKRLIEVLVAALDMAPVELARAA